MIATETQGGIVLPNKVTANEGVVVAIGDGLLQNGIRQPSLVEAGDRITWANGHIPVAFDETLVLVPELAILTKVVPD